MVDFDGDNLPNSIEVVIFETEVPLAWAWVRALYSNPARDMIFARAETLAKFLQIKIENTRFLSQQFFVYARNKVDLIYGQTTKDIWDVSVGFLVSGWLYGQELGYIIGVPQSKIDVARENLRQTEKSIRNDPEFINAISRLQAMARANNRIK